MAEVKRSEENPVLEPNKNNWWEESAVFNGCTVEDNGKFHMLYRAMSNAVPMGAAGVPLSSVGYAESEDGVNFTKRRLLIEPEYRWEMFGCEDPRVTKLGDTFYIFYTAISTWPPTASGIRIAVATTKDFINIEKHMVTPFNAKAMAMFPEKINGKIAALLTANTDRPPAKIGLALFDNPEEIWSQKYWADWYESLVDHAIIKERDDKDHVELGAPPVKTDEGWLFVYSYIQNYHSPPPVFGVEAVLLDLDDPSKVIGETKKPFLVPEADYEINGQVQNIVFPSGALVHEGTLFVYYGGADTVCCVAKVDLNDFLENNIVKN